MTCQKLLNNCTYTQHFALGTFYTIRSTVVSGHVCLSLQTTRMSSYLSKDLKDKLLCVIQLKRQLSFIITSTDRKYISLCEIGHMSFPMQKVVATRKGAKDSTCTNQVEYVPTCPCVYESVCLWLLAPVWLQKCRVCVTTVNENMPAAKRLNERNLENKKRGRRQRWSRTPSVQMWVWKDTRL